MQVPLQITFRGIEGTPAIEAKIREKAAWLERFAEHITSCRVVIEAPHKHHHKGKIYIAKIDIKVPGGEIVASRQPDQQQAHEDLYVAINDTFNSAVRQLEDYVRKQRQDVKVHEAPPHGRIKALFPYEDYGVIETPEGREVYFHRNSILDADFDQLKEGDTVRFAEELGEKGPQASSVHVEGKRHAR